MASDVADSILCIIQKELPNIDSSSSLADYGIQLQSKVVALRTQIQQGILQGPQSPTTDDLQILIAVTLQVQRQHTRAAQV